MASTLNTSASTGNAPEHETLLREVKYRLSYRGTLELDTLCRAALAHVPALNTAELIGLRDFLLEREGDLMAWLIDGKPVPPEHAAQVARLRDWFKATR
jgi:succinate dehydrogenase flavin-adding protein (antitoxin of CptAB toxin-antitoxin module)